MRVEEIVGQQLKRLREDQERSLADVGQDLGKYLGKAWSPQGVWQAENGKRDFKVAQLIAFALVLDCPLSTLMHVAVAGAELSDSHTITRQEMGRLYAEAEVSGTMGRALVDMDEGMKQVSELADEQRRLIRVAVQLVPPTTVFPDLTEGGE